MQTEKLQQTILELLKEHRHNINGQLGIIALATEQMMRKPEKLRELGPTVLAQKDKINRECQEFEAKLLQSLSEVDIKKE